jgi:hypothetical protein
VTGIYYGNSPEVAFVIDGYRSGVKGGMNRRIGAVGGIANVGIGDGRR